MNLRLGRLPHNPWANVAAPTHLFGAQPPLPVLDRRDIDFQPVLGRNDTLASCTVVSLVNMACADEALRGAGLVTEEQSIVDFFATCAGNPNPLESCPGLVYLDVVARASHGFTMAPDRTYYGSPGVVLTNRINLANAMRNLGSVGIGVTLRERDMESFASGGAWDVQEGRDDGAVVGGHAILGWDYDHTMVRVATWGALQPASWAWIMARIDEAHAVKWPQLENLA